MGAMNFGVSDVHALQAAANAQVMQNNSVQNAAMGGGSSSGNFNGTIADLQQKYPDVYNKLVLQQLAYQIVQQCQDENDHYLEIIKESDRQG